MVYVYKTYIVIIQQQNRHHFFESNIKHSCSDLQIKKGRKENQKKKTCSTKKIKNKTCIFFGCSFYHRQMINRPQLLLKQIQFNNWQLFGKAQLQIRLNFLLGQQTIGFQRKRSWVQIQILKIIMTLKRHTVQTKQKYYEEKVLLTESGCDRLCSKTDTQI